MFAARWIMAPIYIGLLLALVMVVVKFVQKLVEAVPGFLALSSSDAIFLVLTLVDLSLVANLVVIVIFAGWANFVGRLLASELDDQPAWLSGMDFATVKLRLIGSIVGDRRDPDPRDLRAHRRDQSPGRRMAARDPAWHRFGRRIAGVGGQAERRARKEVARCRSASSSSPISART